MTSNGGPGSSGSSSMAAKRSYSAGSSIGGLKRDGSETSLSAYTDHASVTDSDGRTRSGDADQALFWAAVSGCLALNGTNKDEEEMVDRRGLTRNGGSGDEEAPTRGTLSFQDSGSASPHSPSHSSDGDDRRARYQAWAEDFPQPRQQGRI